MDVGSTELKILEVTQPYIDQGYSQLGLHLLVGRRVCNFFLVGLCLS